MKTKVRRISKRTMSVVMSLLMVISCFVVGNISASAWTDACIRDSLDNYATARGMTLNDGKNYYYSYYLQNGDPDLYFKFNANYKNLGPSTNGELVDGSSNKKDANEGEANNTFKYQPSWQDAGKYYRVKIWFNGDNAAAKIWYTRESLTNLSASLSATTGTWYTGTSYTLSASASNNVGTKKYTYYYSTNSGSTWTRTGTAETTSSSISFKPTTTGTYTFKVVAKDAGVITGTNASTARTATSSTFTRTVSAPSNHAVSVKVNNSSYGKAAAYSSTTFTDANLITERANGSYVYIKYTERDGSIDADNFKVKKTDGTDVTSSVSKTHTAASNYFRFTMPDYDVIVNVKFKEKNPDADYYYNGLDTSGNSVTDYKHKQMTKATVNGQEFAYYKVTGRSKNTDQCFRIIDETGKFLVIEHYHYWSSSDRYYAFWKNSSYNQLSGSTNWPGDNMKIFDTRGGTNKDQNRYFVYIPSGAYATQVNQNYSGSDNRSEDFTVGSNKNRVYYLSDSIAGQGDGAGRQKGYYTPSEGQWLEYRPKDSYDSNIKDTVYYIGNTRYGSDFAINSHNSGDDYFAKVYPNTDEYYVVVYYPKTNYGTVNSTAVNNTTNYPKVCVYKSLPGAVDTSDTSVNIKVKDGAMTSSTRSSKKVNERLTLASIGSSNIDQVSSDVIVDSIHTYYDNSNDGSTSNADSMGYQEAVGERGKRLRVVTTLTNENYYVKGWNINGKTYGFNEEPHEDDTDLDYVLDINIPSEKEIPESTLEITPIYYLIDTSNTVTLYVDGYTKALQDTGWGNTPYIYPFYGNNNNVENAFGSYPGQPMVFDGGKYQMQIPTIANSPLVNTNQSAKIRGVTISNGYFDKYHADTFSLSSHLQTYDYDDFYKIYNEKKPDNIRFTFKYKTKKNNKAAFSSSTTSNLTESNFNSTNGNGWEDLTNDWGDKCDLFGNPVPSSKLSDTPLHVVSTGYYDNAAGQYGTEWRVYRPNNTLVTATTTVNTSSGTKTTTLKSIVPSALILNDNTTSFAKSEYANNGRAAYNDGNATQIPQYKPMYQALETYRGEPVLITYEQNADRNSSSNWDYAKDEKSSTGASRCDGRWTYSSDGARMQSTIKVQYSNDNGSTWSTINSRTTQNSKTKFFTSGDHANVGLDAYFTNTSDPNIYGLTDTGELYTEKGKYLTFNAEGAGSYIFYEWYMEKTDQHAGFNTSGRTEMTSSDVIVARFIWVTSGFLRIGHNIKGTAAGTSQTRVEVFHSDANTSNPSEADYVVDYSASDIDLPVKYISSNSDYKIKIYLKTTTDGVSRVKNNMFTCREFDGDGNELNNNEGTYAGQQVDFALSYTAGTTGDARFVAQKDILKTGSAVLNVTDLFSGTNQKITKLIFFSELDNGTTAKVKYQYTNRFGVDRTLTFTTKYFDSDGGFPSNQAAVSSNLVGNDKTFMQWIKSKVPAIDDLAKDCTWNFSSIGLDGTNKILTVSATQNAKTYGYKISYNRRGTDETTGTYSRTNSSNGVASDYFVNNLIYNDSSSNFAYWDVYPAVRGDGEWVKKSNNPYARCYNRYFSITLPKDSIIEAIYEDEAVAPEDRDLVSIGEATYTREVYNLVEDGSISDTLFADFVVNYMREDYDKLKDDSSKNKYYTGLILEINNKAKVDDPSNDEAIRNMTFNSDATEIKTIIQRIVDNSATGTQTYDVAGGTDERNAVFNYDLNNTDYNDFNRLDVPISFGNTSTWRKRVMKAYYYVVPVVNGTKDWTNWKLSEPVYFCLNEIGNAQVDGEGKITVVSEN